MDKELETRLEKVLEITPKKGKLLEIGSYPFIITEELIKRGYDVSGLDLNHTRVKIGVQHCNIEKEAFPFKDKTFDIVLMMEVIEHLGINPINAIQESKRVLKDNGIFVLTTPNILRLQNLKSIIIKKKQLATLRSLTQKEKIGYIGHIREYTKNELKEILKYCGFKSFQTCMFEGSSYFPTKFIVSFFPSYSTTIMIAAKKGEKWDG